MNNIIKSKRKKKRASIWADSTKPYGINTGERGNPNQWKSFFDNAMGKDEATAILDSESPWVILGIPLDSKLSIIKQAFRKLAFKTHPDYGGTEAEFRKVFAAYSMLIV